MRTEAELKAERAAIDRAVEGKTLGALLLRNAEEHGSLPAVSWEDGAGAYTTLTWREYREQAAQAAMGLRAIGVGQGDFVAIMARNRVEHLLADLAAVHAGATSVSFYNTLAPEQIQFIAAHCEAKVAVLENREFLQRWEKVLAELPALERVILLEDGEEFADYAWVTSWTDLLATGRGALEAEGGRETFEAMWREVGPEDTATVIYTSGTTGHPKGVVISHRNVLWTAESLDRSFGFPHSLRTVSYLPFAHIAERLASHYLGLQKAIHVTFAPDLLQFMSVVEHVRPRAFFGVPRVWEKVQAGISAKLAEEPNANRRRIALKALDVGRRVARLQREGKPVPIPLSAQRALFDRLVYSKIRHAIGLDQCLLAATAAAPISMDTLEFFAGIGIVLHEIYGMTEDTGPATTNRPGRVRLGTVGEALPGVEVALADDGEILVRGGVVTMGYYRDPVRTAETFGADGWLHTGDIGVLDPDARLRVVDRKKELIITAGGKNVSPANLESLLKVHPLVGQVCVVGDGRPFVAALVVVDGEIAPAWARRNGLAFTTVSEFAREPRVVAEVQRAVDDVNTHVSKAEGIKRFTILPTEWTVDSEELTPTLKLKRRVVHAKYAEEIDAIYAG
jgi:long-chain acyl-CoA synthetase